jgi:hypothetical protein
MDMPSQVHVVDFGAPPFEATLTALAQPESMHTATAISAEKYELRSFILMPPRGERLNAVL